MPRPSTDTYKRIKARAAELHRDNLASKSFEPSAADMLQAIADEIDAVRATVPFVDPEGGGLVVPLALPDAEPGVATNGEV